MRARLAQAVALWLALFAVYHANGSFQEGHDATGNVYLPLQILEHGRPTFRPEEAPLHFTWKEPSGRRASALPLEPAARAAALEDGALRAEPQYYLLATKRPGEYANTFGIGAAILALPLYAALSLVADDFGADPALVWHAGKLVAAGAVAGAAVLLFLIGVRLAPTWAALAAALVYGVATCAWSISSQTLWQHGPNELALALGTYGLVRSDEGRSYGALAGLGYGLAVLCRPDSALVLLAAGAYLLLRRRRSLAPFVGAALVPLAVLVSYNVRYFGDPFVFGQAARARSVAMAKTGATDLWSTPLFEGLAGILVSPSRGLFVYSPILLLSLWGAVVVWRDARWQALRPLTVATLAIWIASALHFDWWSGWSYGYRHLVDTTPVLALSLLPVLPRVRRSRAGLALAAAAMLWSVGVQALGAFSYDLVGWNQLEELVVRVPGDPEPRYLRGISHEAVPHEWQILESRVHDVDLPAHRHRLWSFRDWQILYYARNFEQARMHRLRRVELWLDRFRIPRAGPAP